MIRVAWYVDGSGAVDGAAGGRPAVVVVTLIFPLRVAAIKAASRKARQNELWSRLLAIRGPTDRANSPVFFGRVGRR